MKFVDIFAGVGGFHHSFDKNDECVYAVEKDKYACMTYRHFFPDTKIYEGDIVNVGSLPKHDVFCAGYPCQPFSLAGKKEGFLHPTQGTMFFEIIRLLKINKPKIIILENVKNLRSHNSGLTFKTTIESLEKLGYNLKFDLLSPHTHGNIPQQRERVFMVGFLNANHHKRFVFPEPMELKKSIGDFIDFENNKITKYHQTNLSSPSVKKMIQGVTETNKVYQYRRFYMRDNKSGLCPTLTANMGLGGHNVPLILDKAGVRKLYPEECFGLMGIKKTPPNMSDSHIYKQAGNSVVISVVRRIIKNIKDSA